MSIASEITRLQGVKADILQAIANKGVTVPAGSALDDCPDLIASISSGGGGGAIIGGREYRTVTIGGATWLAENLDYKFSGCAIGPSDNPTTPAAWYYDNDEATYGIDGTRKCGLLYNWYAVKLLEDNKSTLCPGWHVPTDDEWTALTNAVGGTGVAGTRLKAANVSWATSWGGTDDYGFGVLPAGNYDGNFNYAGSNVYFWTITESDSRAYSRSFDAGATMYRYTSYKWTGYSVRLVKDTQ